MLACLDIGGSRVEDMSAPVAHANHELRDVAAEDDLMERTALVVEHHRHVVEASADRGLDKQGDICLDSNTFAGSCLAISSRLTPVSLSVLNPSLQR
jgi:hypothetical protein